MIIKLNISEETINRNLFDFKTIDKICNYINCNIDDLYYIEGIKDSIFDVTKTFLEENNIYYSTNRNGYAFILYKDKEHGDCYIVSDKFIKDLRVIERLNNKNRKGDYL